MEADLRGAEQTAVVALALDAMTTTDEALDAFLAEQEKRLAERTYRNDPQDRGLTLGRGSESYGDISVAAAMSWSGRRGQTFMSRGGRRGCVGADIEGRGRVAAWRS